MSQASDAFENRSMLLYFNNQAFADIGDASGLQPSATEGSLYISLHTADPTDSGNQSTNETSYTNYVRVGVARNGTEWDVSGAVASALNDIVFASAGSIDTLTHFGIGTAPSGAGVLLFHDALDTPLIVGPGITPRITSLTVTVD